MSHVLFETPYVGKPHTIGTSEAIYQNHLLVGETIHYEFKGIRDGCIITDKRLMVISVQGLTGRKKALISIPWKSITAFSIESSGTLDLDSELKLSGMGYGVVKLSFAKGTDLNPIIQFITSKVL